MPPESPALEKLKAARRWSRPDSSCDPWTMLGSLAAGASRRSGYVPIMRQKNRRKDLPWGPHDLAKAARLLERPALPVGFDEDQEMRRVYSLIYDVFRYKGVLEEALCEAGFYETFKEAEKRKTLAWLLLFDQQKRRWAKRDLLRDPSPTNYYKKIRERSRNRRKQSKDSLKMSRDSSADSRKTNKLSRDSSLDTKEASISRSSLIRAKVRAIRELSKDAKEAIRLVRESSDLKNGSIPRDTDAYDSDDPKPKYKKIREITNNNIVDMYENKLDDIMAIKEEGDFIGIRDDIDASSTYSSDRKASRDSIDTRTSEELEYTISRNEMRNVMVSVSGEIGQMVKEFDIALWESRVKIAAAIAKIRIRNKALTLSQLLPIHLRDDRVSLSLNREVVTGWVNVFKSRSITELVQRLNEMGYSYSTSRTMGPNQFRFDKHCSKFITIKPAIRTDLMRSSLLVDNIIILQEREFCLGAAALCQALRDAQLHGDVVQTHGTSPRAAAYLAAQLRDWPAYQGHLIVFGAGDRKSEYESFLKALGATNAKVVAEGVNEAGGFLWSGVVAALAAPPNSYSAVGDPIDLVCSRGGDLGMLEILTESEISLEGRNRVMKILEEQKKTLRLCMSKPQIQMVMYETHSALSAENADMVRRAVAEANRAARELHALRKMRAKDALPKPPKCAMQTQPNEGGEFPAGEEAAKPSTNGPVENPIVPNNDDVDKAENKEVPITLNITEETSQQPITPIDPDSEYSDIIVPDCDLFEEQDPHPLAEMILQDREGCFLALIKRKELIRMNAKYMINVAEARGLFGGNSPQPRRPPPTRKKVEDIDNTKQMKRRITKREMERIAAPTHAWSARVGTCTFCTNGTCTTCSACARRHAALATTRARLWWHLALEHVLHSKSNPLRLPRGVRPQKPSMTLPVAEPQFESSPARQHYPSSVYTRVLEVIPNI